MSDYDEYFDTIDDGVLAQVDALEAIGELGRSPNKPPAASTKKSSKSASISTPGDSDSALFDLTLDVNEMEKLEEAAARRLNAQPGPSRQGASRQIDLHGRPLPPQSPEKQVQHRPVFGQKMRKTKVWDQTAFAKTGWRSTKPVKSKKGKGKAVADDEGDDDEECVDLHDVPAPFMPRGAITTMKLQPDKLSTREWIYPLNKPKRDYQFNIVRHSLFENCLVAIPTGVGKTFIAGCVMLNYYRWFPEGKIIFVAPTKPLVAQQIEASHQSCGIPGTDAIELTGQISRGARAAYWKTKRVFYMTPQTLVNDLAMNICDPNKVALLVIDEAHKGTGDYAYAQIVRFMMATNPFFRILALTATPGSKPEAVQAIVDSLHISHIEIRNEGSMDVQPYMHKKTTTQHVVDMTGGLVKIRDLLIKLMNVPLTTLRNAGILWQSDPVQVKDFLCTTKMRDLGPSQKWAWGSLKALGALARVLGYFMEFSVGMAYNSLLDLGQGSNKKEPAKTTQSKISRDPNYIAIMKEIERQRNDKGAFPTHPKMEKLRMLAIQHFAGAEIDEEEKAKPGSKPAESMTKMIVFCTYRDCVDEIVDMLNDQQPMIRAHRFIGQGTDKRGGKGVTQKAQIGVIRDFKEGKYNVIVSTSIGEEGLDIGEVDIIVCYDAQKAAIRMVQRVGRTGRKKDGKVEVLLAKGREEGNWASALGAYKDVQQSIVRGTDLELYGDVKRLIPEDVQPQCVEMVMEIIPYEREERKRSTSGPKSKQTALKFDEGKGKAIKKRGRQSEEEEGEGIKSPQKKRQRKFVDSDSDSGGPKPEPKTKTSVSKRAGSSSKPVSERMKSRPAVTQTGFLSARALVKNLNGSDEELDVETKLAKSGAKTGRASPLKSVPRSKKWESSVIKTKTSSTKSMNWLLDSDSESEIKPVAAKGKRQAPVIDFEDSDGSDIEIIEDVASSSKRPFLVSVIPLKGLPNSPDSSFPNLPSRRRVCPPIANTSPNHIQDPPSPVLQRLRRGGGVDRGFMPPPTAMVASTWNKNAPAIDSERPNGMRPTKRSILDRNEFLEIEAIHSGDEVEAGSSDPEGEANSSDREFVVDTSATQAPSDYDQSAIYRQGLFTQAPMDDAPRFQTGPIRTGFLGRGRISTPAVSDAASSSPFKDDELDRYSYGSFVVEDGDDVLIEGSSEP